MTQWVCSRRIHTFNQSRLGTITHLDSMKSTSLTLLPALLSKWIRPLPEQSFQIHSPSSSTVSVRQWKREEIVPRLLPSSHNTIILRRSQNRFLIRSDLLTSQAFESVYPSPLVAVKSVLKSSARVSQSVEELSKKIFGALRGR